MVDVLLCQGTALHLPLKDASIHTVCTSPPYWQLRRYDCGPGEVGLEPTIEAYVAALVQVFREVRRVLHPTGTLWLNLSDTYNSARGGAAGHLPASTPIYTRGEAVFRGAASGLKEKDLCMIPARVAMALQADGWVLRAEVIWHKVNPMPECLDPATQVFIRQGTWVSRITLDQLTSLPVLPEILGPQGWVQIRHLWRTVKPAIALEAGKVEHVICSPEHRFPISSDRRRERITEKEAQDIRHEGYADYFLYCPIGRFLAPTLHTWMGRDLNHALGYLLGVYAAEGGHDGTRGFRLKFTIGAHEEVFAADIRTALKECDLDASETADESSRNFRFSTEWFHRTVDAFVAGNVTTKSLNIELLLNCPQPFRQAVLQGYVDGDGSTRRGGGWIAASASRRLRDDIATLASSVGIITSKGSRAQYDSRTDKTYHAHSLWTPYMTKRQPKSGLEGIFQVPPRRRKPLDGMREMIDIEVEGGLFLIGDGLITHNSVQDRPTRSHEQVFLFSKQPHYFYDATEVAELSAYPVPASRVPSGMYSTLSGRHDGEMHRSGGFPTGAMRACRSVWSLPSEPSGFQHYAAFPTALVRRCLLAGAPSQVCSACGAPWKRGRVPTPEYARIIGKGVHDHAADGVEYGLRQGGKGPLSGEATRAACPNGLYVNTEAAPTCACLAGTQPCTVFDPFCGSGTTLLVARELGHHAVGVDLSWPYLSTIARTRLGLTALHAWQHGATPQPVDYTALPLFAKEADA